MKARIRDRVDIIIYVFEDFLQKKSGRVMKQKRPHVSPQDWNQPAANSTRPHRCTSTRLNRTFCQAQFAEQLHLRRHFLDAHYQAYVLDRYLREYDNPIPCQQSHHCVRRFNQARSMVEHMRFAHPQQHARVQEQFTAASTTASTNTSTRARAIRSRTTTTTRSGLASTTASTTGSTTASTTGSSARTTSASVSALLAYT